MDSEGRERETREEEGKGEDTEMEVWGPRERWHDEEEEEEYDKIEQNIGGIW